MESVNAIVIGAGINGLVAANYLARAGKSVLLLEKKEQSGGACTFSEWKREGYEFAYPPGASVFGLMQDFVYEETGLSKRLQLRSPGHVPLIYFPGDHEACVEYSDTARFVEEARTKWGEDGNIEAYYHDLDQVIDFLRKGYRDGTAPSLSKAEAQLGSELVGRFIRGSAWDLVHHYFSSEKCRMYHCMPVTESGPVSLKSPYSAFTIAMMSSGTVLDGSWGYIKGGIWRVTETLAQINRELGVRLEMGAELKEVDPHSCRVSFESRGKLETVKSDAIFFATDPVTTAKLLHQEQRTHGKPCLGSSGKLVMFFSQPIRWSDTSVSETARDALRFVYRIETLQEMEACAQEVRTGTRYVPTSFQIYSDGLKPHTSNPRGEYLAVFFKDLPFRNLEGSLNSIQSFVESSILPLVSNPEDHLGSHLSTPFDLSQKFYFPGGNLDHMEVCKGQTFFSRTYSDCPDEVFYQFGNFKNVRYCGAGTYPCGSVTGTPAFLAVSEWLRSR